MSEQKYVMLIDDDPLSLQLTEMILRVHYPQTETVSFQGAEPALEFLKSNEHKPAIILLDLNMPMMTGWDFLDRYTDKTDVFILTSSKEKSDLEKRNKYEVVKDYLVKPLDMSKAKKICNRVR